MHLEQVDKTLKLYIYDTNKIEEINKIKEEPEKFFKGIFITLKNKYHIRLNGLYKIDLYICDDYGIIIEINHEDDELYDEYMEGVDLKIKIADINKALFEIKDIFLVKDKKNVQIFKYNDKFYMMFVNSPSKKEIYNIIEHSKVIYGKIVKKIVSPYNLVNI